MEQIKTYVINLESSSIRKKYMTDLLSPFSFLDVEFIKAIDGRKLTEQECALQFDAKSCLTLIGRQLSRGEIGCTLSHYACYKALLESTNRFVLILEDDIAPVRDLNELGKYNLNKYLISEEPIVLFLSGDLWYLKQNPISTVYAAVGSYAYFINRAAAKLILSLGIPKTVADAWSLYRRKGLKLKGILPYMIDANINMDMLPSDIAQDVWGQERTKMSFRNLILTCYEGIVKKILKSIGHFEKKIRVINNVIVDD